MRHSMPSYFSKGCLRGRCASQDLGFLSIACDSLVALLEPGDVGHQRFHIVRRQIGSGHAAGFHLRGGMEQEMSELIARELRAYSDESGPGSRAYSSIAMACIARLRFENRFPLRSERIGQRYVDGGE